VRSSAVHLVAILIRYVKYIKIYVELFRKYNVGKKWGFYKFGDVEMREGSELQRARQHTINFRAIASSKYKRNLSGVYIL